MTAEHKTISLNQKKEGSNHFRVFSQMRPSLHLNRRNEGEFTVRIGFGTLNHVISDCKIKRYRLNHIIFSLEREMLSTLSYADFNQNKAISENSFQHDF